MHTANSDARRRRKDHHNDAHQPQGRRRTPNRQENHRGHANQGKDRGKSVVPTHASCRQVADAIRNKTPIPKAVYHAHVPEFVGRNGELAYLTTPITRESCERVARALTTKEEKVPRAILLAHVPKFVSHSGEIHFDGEAEEEHEDDYALDIDDAHWIGIENKGFVVFGEYEDDGTERKLFQSMFFKLPPTEDELTAIGELMVFGIEPGTAQSILQDLQRAKMKQKQKERQKETPA